MTSVVMVCTGNICRSPAAELLAARALGPDAVVSSAGTAAMVGYGIPAEMLKCLDEDGLDGRSHVGRLFTPAIASGTDLVIGMAAEHRARAISAAPFALKRTFMLSEIATAAREGAPLSGGLAGVAKSVQDYRAQLAGRSLPDVPDPYRRSQSDYDEAYAMIREAIEDIAAWVRG